MSTFGPVYARRGFVRNGLNYYAPLTKATAGLQYDKPFFFGVDSDDDLKPVVHVKPSGVPVWRPLEKGSNIFSFYEYNFMPWNSASTSLSSMPRLVGWYSTGEYCLFVQISRCNNAASGGKIGVPCEISVHSLVPKQYTTGYTMQNRGIGNIVLDYSLRFLSFSYQDEGSGLASALTPPFRKRWGELLSEGKIKSGRMDSTLPPNSSVSLTVSAAKILFDVIVDTWLAYSGRFRCTFWEPQWPSFGWLPQGPSKDWRAALLFSEDEIQFSGSPGRIQQPWENYWLGLLRTRAFVDACENMPALSDNSISNLKEIFEFLLSIVRREPPKIPKRLSEAWLAYRYQVMTTKMDLAEAWTFVNRYYDLGSMYSRGITHGVYRITVDDILITARATLSIEPTHNRCTADLASLWRDMSTLGVAPDLYYIWDSTPFSFIVDWFLPIGTLLEAVDASMLYTTQAYKFGPICYSLSYQRDVDGRPAKCFSRWIEDRAPLINPLYWLEDRASASKRQIVYRAADAVSLFIGGA